MIYPRSFFGMSSSIRPSLLFCYDHDLNDLIILIIRLIDSLDPLFPAPLFFSSRLHVVNSR